MLLIAWRKSKRLTLAEISRAWSESISQMSDLERGQFNALSMIRVVRIEAATGGKVKLRDHWKAWRAANARDFTLSRAAGRSGAEALGKPARKRKSHGKSSKR